MTPEQREKFNEYHSYMVEANRMRGEIINNCVNLERWLDEILAFYFCELNYIKREAFLSLFLVSGKVTLNSKVSVFKSIIPVLPGLSEDDKEYFKDTVRDLIKRIIPARNAIAHRALEEIDFKESYKEKKTVYKDKYSIAESFEIDNWDFAKILQATSDYTGRFIGLVNLLEMIYKQR